MANAFWSISFLFGSFIIPGSFFSGLSIFPKSLDWLAGIIGVDYPPALFLSVAVVILFIMNFIQSKKIVELQKKVVDLGQELSIIKK